MRRTGLHGVMLGNGVSTTGGDTAVPCSCNGITTSLWFSGQNNQGFQTYQPLDSARLIYVALVTSLPLYLVRGSSLGQALGLYINEVARVPNG